MTPSKKSGLGKKVRLSGLLLAGAFVSGSCIAADVGQPQQGIEALLQKVEHRVVDNHLMFSEGDSAVDAWEQALQAIPSTDPIRVKNALKNVAVHWRRRANEARHDKNIEVADGLSFFAAQAEGMIPPLARSTPSSAGRATILPVASVPMTVPALELGESSPARTPVPNVPSPQPGAEAAAPEAAAGKPVRTNNTPDVRQHPYVARRNSFQTVNGRAPERVNGQVIERLLY